MNNCSNGSVLSVVPRDIDMRHVLSVTDGVGDGFASHIETQISLSFVIGARTSLGEHRDDAQPACVRENRPNVIP